MMGILALLTTISGGMRYLPFLFAKQMQKIKFLQKIAITLPATLSILLVAHCVESTSFGIAEAIGLSVCAILQVFWRNLLISMLGGVILHQIVLHLWVA